MHGNQQVYPLKKLEHLIPNITFAPEIRYIYNKKSAIKLSNSVLMQKKMTYKKVYDSICVYSML